MKVLRFKLEPLEDCRALLEPKVEIVDKPFSWVVERKPYVMPDQIDVGEVDADDICVPMFDNWKRFGVGAGDRSRIIPANIDLSTHPNAHRTLRLFGTLAMVESIQAKDFKAGADGLAAYAQMLMRCKYVAGSADFDRDLLPAAKRRLTKWTKDSIYAFVSFVLAKNIASVSLGDIAQVIGSLTGTKIDESEKDFNLEKVLENFPVEVAADKRPDEFFTAAIGAEIMEAHVLKSLLVDTEEGLFFAADVEWSDHWTLKGPEGVQWQVEIHRRGWTAGGTALSFAPAAGTLYDRALSSKRKMLPLAVDAVVPFSLVSTECTTAVDSGAFEMSPGKIPTGIRFLSTDCSLPIYRVSVPSTDYRTLERELRGQNIKLPPTPNSTDIENGIGTLYAQMEKQITAAMSDKCFMVFEGSLDSLAKEPDNLTAMKNLVNSDRVMAMDPHLLPGVLSNVRSLVVYAWVLKHIQSDTVCCASGENDTYSVASAIEYSLRVGVEGKKPKPIYLVASSYSEPFQGRKVRGADLAGSGISPDFVLD